VLVAGWIGIVTAAIGARCAIGSGSDCSSSDADGNPPAYCCTAVNATAVSTTVVDATAVDASATNPAAICGGLS
jgi:hypothetical protein